MQVRYQAALRPDLDELHESMVILAEGRAKRDDAGPSMSLGDEEAGTSNGRKLQRRPLNRV